MKTAYIVKAYRTAVGKAPKGVFRFKRTDELAAETIKYMMKELPGLDPKRIDDVIVGNAMPEGSQGLNMAPCRIRKTLIIAYMNLLELCYLIQGKDHGRGIGKVHTKNEN